MQRIRKVVAAAALVTALANTPAYALGAGMPSIEELTSKAARLADEHLRATEALARRDKRLAEARGELADVRQVLPDTPREEAASVAAAVGAFFSPGLADRVSEIADGLEVRNELTAEISRLEGGRDDAVERVDETRTGADEALADLDAAQRAAAAAAAQAAQAEAERIRASYAPSVRLMVDPGHGGKDPGAASGTITEKELNMLVSQKVVEAAVRQGWTVGTTREGDWFVPLDARPASANGWGATAMVSVHSNSGGPAARGNMTIFRSPAGAALGQQIMEELDPLTPYGDIGNRGDVRGLAVLRGAQVPAVIVEVLSLSSPEELAQVVTPEVQRQYAEAIVKGVADFHGIAYVPPVAPVGAAAEPPAIGPVADAESQESTATENPERRIAESAATPPSDETWLGELFALLTR